MSLLRAAALVLLTALALALAPAPPGRAGTDLERLQRQIQEKRGNLDEINRQIDRIQSQLDQKQRQERNKRQQLARLEQQLDRTEGELRTAREELAAAQARLEATIRELARAEEELARRDDLLGRRLRALYEHGTVTYLDVLLSATSFADLVTRYENLKLIYEADRAALERAAEYREYVVAVKARQEAEKAQVEALVQRVEATKARLEQDRAATERARQELLQDIEELRRAYDELERLSQQLTAELQRLERELAEQLRRTGAIILQRPLSGPITSPFGMRYHPILKQRRMHTGTDYAAPYGTPIRAAESGIVTHADWLGGYGKAVIIMHGKGVSTLYAHMSEIKVARGQRVERGQVIGLVGSTGLSTGPHLHFEVRIDGEPRDPEQYLGRPLS